jgi:hypothetical protein
MAIGTTSLIFRLQCDRLKGRLILSLLESTIECYFLVTLNKDDLENFELM